MEISFLRDLRKIPRKQNRRHPHMANLRAEVAQCEHSGYDFVLSAHRWRARSRKDGSVRVFFPAMIALNPGMKPDLRK